MRYVAFIAIPCLLLGLSFGFAYWIRKGKSERARSAAERFGVTKMDEMERVIQYKAVVIAYNVMLFGLLGCTFYSSFVKREALPLSNLVLLLGLLTQGTATLVLRYRNTKGDEEYRPYAPWKTLLWIVGIAALIGILGGLLTIAGLAL